MEKFYYLKNADVGKIKVEERLHGEKYYYVYAFDLELGSKQRKKVERLIRFLQTGKGGSDQGYVVERSGNKFDIYFIQRGKREKKFTGTKHKAIEWLMWEDFDNQGCACIYLPYGLYGLVDGKGGWINLMCPLQGGPIKREIYEEPIKKLYPVLR